MSGPLPALPTVSIIAADLQKRLRLKTFIDTGTWEGLTAIWAAEHFARVHTIEIDEVRFHAVRRTIAHKGLEETIVTHLGDSRRVLERLIPFVDPTTFFWLGARTEDDCPLMDELALIRGGSDSHIIMIDDIHSFQRRTYEKWPSFLDICKAVTGLAFFVGDGVLVAFPHEYTEVVIAILHKVRGE